MTTAQCQTDIGGFWKNTPFPCYVSQVNVFCIYDVAEPGVLAVCPVRPCLLVNDEPSGWEFFSKRGWDVVTVPEPDLLQSE